MLVWTNIRRQMDSNSESALRRSPLVSDRSVHFSFPLPCRTYSLANHPVDAERKEHDDSSAQRGSSSAGQITGSGLRGRFVEPVDDLRSGETGYDERQYASANRCPVHFISPFASFSQMDRLPAT